MYGTNDPKDKDGSYDDDESCTEQIYDDGTIEIECGWSPTVGNIFYIVMGTICFGCITSCWCEERIEKCKKRCFKQKPEPIRNPDGSIMNEHDLLELAERTAAREAAKV